MVRKFLFIFVGLMLMTGACSPRTAGKSLADPYTVNLNPADFVPVVDNPYFPLKPGAKLVYEGQTADGLERIEIEVLSETRQVIGITATVLRDTVTLDGVIIEDTFDWYAQDKEGAVWYLGEDVSNYENGQLADKKGSWEAGVDGALPGIIMPAKPAEHVGVPYRQEFYKGEAEDVAEVLSLDESVTVPGGSFAKVLKTKDTSLIDGKLLENKFYAQGIGVIKEVDLKTGEEVNLIKFTPPGG